MTSPARVTRPAQPQHRPQTKHGVVEDVLGLLVGTVLASFGLFLLHSSSTVTGGTAGLALLLSYALPVPFGAIFVAVNLPFLIAAISRKGLDFTLRTLLAIAVLTALTALHTAVVPPLTLPPLYAALLGNVLAGVGLLILFRHRASLGGFNIVGLIMQERRGIPAGYVQLVLDLMVLLASLIVLPLPLVAVSALGAVVLNVAIALNHRADRYTGW